MLIKQISIKSLNLWLFVTLSVILTIGAIFGYTLLHKTYNFEETKFRNDTKLQLQQATQIISSQLTFYQSILDTISRNPKLPDLIEFGEEKEIIDWTIDSAQLLPHSLGLAITDYQDTVIGDAASQRIGALCQQDVKQFNQGKLKYYPPIHTGVASLEHFDLYTQIKSNNDEQNTLIVSFKLDKLTQLLNNITTPASYFEIISNQNVFVSSGNPSISKSKDLFKIKQRIGETDWELALTVPQKTEYGLYSIFVLVSLISVLSISLIILFVTNKVTHHFEVDIKRIHQALLDVGKGEFNPSGIPTALTESQEILPDIEKIALKLQIRHNKLQTQSMTDELTGIANRRYFNVLLAHQFEQSRRKQPSYLVNIDLNDFKMVNDQYGHATGDALLIHISQHFGRHIRSSDTVARIGGDEFAILLQSMDSSALGEWAEDFISAFDSFIGLLEIDGAKNIACSLSVGIAIIDIDTYDSIEEVSRAADKAMYKAKANKTSSSKVLIALPHKS